MSDKTRHFISDRQLCRALDKEDGGAQMEAVRELLDEAWNKGFSAGQMKGRLK